MSKPCNMCYEQIDEHAKICKVCKHSQSRMIRGWKLVQAMMTVIVSVGSLSIAIIQIDVTKAEVKKKEAAIEKQEVAETYAQSQRVVSDVLLARLSSTEVDELADVYDSVVTGHLQEPPVAITTMLNDSSGGVEPLDIPQDSSVNLDSTIRAFRPRINFNPQLDIKRQADLIIKGMLDREKVTRRGQQ